MKKCWLSVLTHPYELHKVNSVIKDILFLNLCKDDKNDYICNRTKPSVVYVITEIRNSEDMFLKSPELLLSI